MSKKHRWIFVAMVAIPFIIALGFRTYDNYQFHRHILSNPRKVPNQVIEPTDPFEDDCKNFLLNFKVNF